MPVNLFAPLIRRPIGTSLLALGLALAGLWAYLLLGVAALPAIEFPGMVVYTEVPGANAQTMASTVAAPLERHLGRIPGIKEMHSESNDGSTSIRILFNFGNNTDKLARDVQAAINAARVDLPSSMTVPPRYYKFNTAQHSRPAALAYLRDCTARQALRPGRYLDQSGSGADSRRGAGPRDRWTTARCARRAQYHRAGRQGSYRQRRGQRTARRQRDLARRAR